MNSMSRSATDWPQMGLRTLTLAVLIALLVAAFMLSLAMGSVRIPLDNILRILTGGIPDRATWSDIVFKFRLPKAMTATLAGAALSVAGLQMQTLFRNPLADPFVLGVSSGASLGVALVILGASATGSLLLSGLGIFGDLAVATAASVGAGLVLVLVLLVMRRVQNTLTLLLLGIMFGYFSSAIVQLLIYFSLPERVQAFSLWSAGSFGGVTWDQMRVFAPVVILGLVGALLMSKSLNALLLGDSYARSLGLNVRRARVYSIISASLMAGAVTAFCGPVGFIGIAVPHLCRSMFNSADHRVLLPTSLLLGAIVALLADVIAQLPGQQIVLPVNVITSLFGVPVIIWLLLRQQQVKASFAG